MDAMIRSLHDAPKAAGHDRIYVAGEIEHETELKRVPPFSCPNWCAMSYSCHSIGSHKP